MNEVIIDGCNVAECDCYDNTYCLWSKKYHEIRITPKCEIVKDCYFKQLQRAKAELEQYKKSKQASYEAMQEQWNNAINENRLLRTALKNKNFVAIAEENERLEAENEKLKLMLSEKYGVYR